MSWLGDAFLAVDVGCNSGTGNLASPGIWNFLLVTMPFGKGQRLVATSLAPPALASLQSQQIRGLSRPHIPMEHHAALTTPSPFPNPAAHDR